MSRLLTCIAVVFTALAGMAQAKDAVVVELFTSQGCSSCPPADGIMSELVTRNDIFALAYHVDYWDYLGWADEFADPRYTNRQRDYARAKGERSIYTPQMIIGGVDHVVGSKPMKIAQAIQRHAGLPDSVTVRAERKGDRILVRAMAERPFGKPAIVRVVTYLPEATRQIRKGENAGRTISYVNIVTGWQDLGTWNGSGEFQGSVNVPGGVPAVVLVQIREAGPILGAARLR